VLAWLPVWSEAQMICMWDDVVHLMPLPLHHLLLQENPEWFTFLVPVYLSGAGLPRLSWKKGR